MFAEVYIITVVLTLGIQYLMHYCCVYPIPAEEIEDKLCSICLEELKDVRRICKTKCNHYYCEGCLKDWLTVKQVCPMCNESL
jgi:hypothetical protein